MAVALLKEKSLKSETRKIKDVGFKIPANAKGTLELVLILDRVEQLASTYSLWFNIYEFVNNEWRHVTGAKWGGGDNNDPAFPDGYPRLWFDVSRVAGKNIRIEIDDPKGLQIGYKVNLI